MKERDYEIIRKGASDLAILCLLEERDMYVYEIGKEITKRSGGLYTIPDGTLYIFMYRLSEHGFLSERKELVGKRRTRVYYHLEPEGKQYLDKLFTKFKESLKGLDLFYLNIHREEGGDEKGNSEDE